MVQRIDLEAAKGDGTNDSLVTRIGAALPCRVGGGIRTVSRAQNLLAAGATHVIVSSALFNGSAVNVPFARELAGTVGVDRVIAAVDSRGGRIAVHGWRTRLDIATLDAVRALEPFVGEFLYTHIDREGLMQGTDMAAIAAVRKATARRVTAAGGITTLDEVRALDALGVDAVVGMAIYTGRMNPADSL
jgi:phosphoribosylformimino-5-aminoimidazole carboxamide ribonucleotide (ProFAR) isomerase